MFMRHRIKMINRLQITRNFLLGCLDISFSSPSTTFFTFTFFFTVRSSQSTPVTLEQKSRHNAGSSRKKRATATACSLSIRSECCCDGLPIRHDLDLRARHGGFDAGFDFFERFHNDAQHRSVSITVGGCKTSSGLAGGFQIVLRRTRAPEIRSVGPVREMSRLVCAGQVFVRRSCAAVP